MALIPFDPPPGSFEGDTVFATKGRWRTASNVRFWNGKPQTIGGWTKMFATALTGTPRLIFALNRSGTVNFAYGTGSKLYVGAGAVQPTDRSPVGLPSGITSWSMGPWGSTLLASPTGGTLYQQSGTSTATEVTQAPDRITCMLVTPERQVLALGCNEEISTIFNGLCIRGCDLEDFTNWTTSATNNAFEHVLDGVGQIVAARLIGSYVAVWTETSLYLGQYIGDPSQTYRFDKVDDRSGITGPDAVAIVGGRAFWIAPDQRILTWVPGELPTAIECPITSIFTYDLASRDRPVVAVNSRFGEIWIFIPNAQGGASENARYVAFSIKDGHWFQGVFGRTAVLDSGILANVLGATYNSTIIAAASTGYVYIHEYGITADGGLIGWSITSGGFYLDEGQQRMMIRSIRPDFFEHSGSVALRLTTRKLASDQDAGDWIFTIPASAEKKDFRRSAMIFTIGFSEGDTSVSMRLGRVEFDAIPIGLR
jgi:hypothetical protein